MTFVFSHTLKSCAIGRMSDSRRTQTTEPTGCNLGRAQQMPRLMNYRYRLTDYHWARVMTDDTTPRHLVVVGDILNDRHLYAGERNTPAKHDHRGVTVINQHGGAHLLHRLIARVFGLSQAKGGSAVWTAILGVEPPRLDSRPCGYDAYAIWRPFPQSEKAKEEDDPKVWRAAELMGYGHTTETEFAGLKAAAARNVTDSDLLVFDDAGFLFRRETEHPSWALAERGKGFVLLKMSEPVAQGELWHHLLEHCRERLVCLVSARDLRREKLGLSRGLSWEATLDDLRLALHYHPAAQQLREAQHVVVTFSADGALWLDHTDRAAPRASICFDPMRAEGEWETRFRGGAFGFHCAMAAALALGLARHTDARQRDPTAPLDLLPAIEAGLLAMRDLKEHGHGPVSNTVPEGYPVSRVAAKIVDAHNGNVDKKAQFGRTSIGWPKTPGEADPQWSIVETSQGNTSLKTRRKLLDLAWSVAHKGTEALEMLPHARFGKLLTADRAEIETLRHIRQRMRAYRYEAAPKRPLSIGVFGPPGAGKSFGVKQLTEEVFGDKSWRDFNLSQFNDSADLNGAFHQVRDLALAGLTPVVLWDEFDSRNLHWLQYLLAPMQDGRFQDRQLNHAIGKCVFIFAGGTSRSYAEFAGRDGENEFRSAKGPDFVSRLDGHIDVLGPDQRTLPQDRRTLAHDKDESRQERKPDPTDIGYPLRRALLIRSYLGCKAAEKVDFDPHLLHALLSVNQYRHGARSLEKLIELLRGGEERVLRRSNLPRPEQLEMYVDVPEFLTLIQGEEVAAGIHETWRDLGRVKGGSLRPRFDKPYADLEETDKEDNRAAGRRIPEILGIVGLGLRRAGDGDEPAVPDAEWAQILEQHIEKMAEAEHNGWMGHRTSIGWRYDPIRNDEKLLHPAMRPYAELPEKEKDKDRNSVRHYPDFAARANHRIVRLPSKF
jgi:hypothetical protein